MVCCDCKGAMGWWWVALFVGVSAAQGAEVTYSGFLVDVLCYDKCLEAGP